MQPIVIGAFTLTATGMEVVGRPTFGEYQGVGDFIKGTYHRAGWWLGEWLAYGESRADWAERLSQAHDVTGLSEKTLANIRSIHRGVDKSRRRENLEFSLHGEVASLKPDEQEHWLEQAEVEGWSVRELRAHIQSSKRRTVLKGQADTLHTVDVTVRLVVEAATSFVAEDRAKNIVKAAVAGAQKMHVIGAHALPHIGASPRRKAG